MFLVNTAGSLKQVFDIFWGCEAWWCCFCPQHTYLHLVGFRFTVELKMPGPKWFISSGNKLNELVIPESGCHCFLLINSIGHINV